MTYTVDKVQETNVDEIVKGLRDSGIPPRFEPRESRLLIRVLRLVAEGQPVPLKQVEQIASNLGMPPQGAVSFVSRVAERDSAGNIVGILGLSQNNHPHRFEINEHRLSTWCAWDSLFLPPLLNKTAKVESSCPATGRIIRLTISPNKVDQYDPTTTALSIIPLKTTKQGPDSVEEIWTTFCHYVHFFSSPAVASQWFSSSKMKSVILSVEAGYQLGRLAFDDLLKFI